MGDRLINVILARTTPS